MAIDPNVCRLCLKVVDKHVSCTPLTNNKAVLQNLNVISFNTINNLQLTVDPVLCQKCEDTLRKLASFKETIIANEFQIQCNQKDNRNSFLDTLSSTYDKICRLCLRSLEHQGYQENWKNKKQIFVKCNIHLNLSISKPSKMCLKCDRTLQEMWEFILDLIETEKRIIAYSNTDKALTAKNLLAIVKVKPQNSVSVDARDIENSDLEEDNNNLEIATTPRETINIRCYSRKPKTLNEKEKIHCITEMSKKVASVPVKATKRQKIPIAKGIEEGKTNISLDTPPQVTRTYSKRKIETKDKDISNIKSTNLSHSPVKNSNRVDESLIDAPLNDVANITVDITRELEKASAFVDAKTLQLIEELKVESTDKTMTKTKSGGTATLSPETPQNTNKPVTFADKNSKSGKSRRDSKTVLTKQSEGTRRPGLRQKTIVTSFKDVLENMKTKMNEEIKKKEETSPGQKRGRKRLNEGEEESIQKRHSNSKEFQETEQNLNVSTNELSSQSEFVENGEGEEDETENSAHEVENAQENDEDSDDVFEEEPVSARESKVFLDKPVPVTILKRKKRGRPKIDREKAWQELTGKRVDDIKEEKTFLDISFPSVDRTRKGKPKMLKKKTKPEIVYLECPCCPFKTPSQNMFIQHQYIHSVFESEQQQLFTCSQCVFRTTTQEQLNQHQATHVQANLLYKCMFCDYSQRKKVSTMNHTVFHDDKDIVNMFYCQVQNEDTMDEYFECFQCDFQSPEEAIMPDHVIDHQQEKIRNPLVAKFWCNKCPYKTKSEEMLIRHKELHGLKKKKKSTSIVKQENDGEDKKDEESGYDPNVGYKCDMCTFTCTQKRSLTNHRTMKHFRKPIVRKLSGELYRCAECDYTTYRKENMPRHALVHKTKENMEYIECPHCIFETKHRRSFTRHMLIKHQLTV